jgi:23S rRNA pseudouridine2457 synthase
LHRNPRIGINRAVTGHKLWPDLVLIQTGDSSHPTQTAPTSSRFESPLETPRPEPKTPAVLIAFNKPYGVLSQFTGDGSPNRTLGEFGFPKGVYPIGRLDADSEGLLLLSDEPELNERLLHPRHAHEREYWAQVELVPTPETLQKLSCGVLIQGRKTLPCRAWLLDPQPLVASSLQSAANANDDKSVSPRRDAATPIIPQRDPPIRFRKSVPDCWIGLELVEGKNRQVRRITAAIGHPTLRLLRVRIGKFHLAGLSPGSWKLLSAADRADVLS